MTYSSEMGGGFRNIEIRHFEGYDMIINRAQNSLEDEKMYDLESTLKGFVENSIVADGKFGDWSVVKVDGRGKHFVDNPDSPKFFVKQKWMHVGDSKFETNWTNNAIRNVKNSQMKSMYQAGNSVMSELRLYEKISKLLSSEEVKEIFADYNLREIKSIEPLAAIISRSNGIKYMIYPYVKGRGVGVSLGRNAESSMRGDCNRLFNFFLTQGIWSGDLDVDQFLVDVEARALYVTDIEAFAKKQFGESGDSKVSDFDL